MVLKGDQELGSGCFVLLVLSLLWQQAELWDGVAVFKIMACGCCWLCS